jgi:hypothetical protein
VSLTSKLLSASGGGITYVDDVFSAYTYTGNGGTQTINNGIDLAGKGGLVWTKSRDASGGHYLVDSATSLKWGQSNTTAAFSGPNVISSFNSTGYTLGINSGANSSASPLVSWTFRKSPKFFDIVTYTGNGVDQRILSHNLGIIPGLVIIKRTDAVSNWVTWHRQFGNTNGFLRLNTTDSTVPGAEAPVIPLGSSTQLYLSDLAATNDSVNINGATYVAYLFAHDDSADSIIKCGSYTPSSLLATITLGWEPQFILAKNTSGGDWLIYDNSRGLGATGGKSLLLNPNNSQQEVNNNDGIIITSTGFETISLNSAPNQTGTYIYIAIRRSNKPPTLGTQVYSAIARTGTGAAATVTGVGFAPDLVIAKLRAVATITYGTFDRLRGRQSILETTTTAAEQNLSTATQDLTSFDMDGISVGVVSNSNINWSPQPIINYFFKRAVGVFDEVCYTGTGSARTVQHGLGVVPELIIVKSRSASALWLVYSNFIGNTQYGVLNATDSFTTGGLVWNNTSPTEQSITLGTFSGVNTNSDRYVAYLFASKAGISKVFSYTGNGTSQTIDCGFTTGARFIMVKRTDSTGDWMISDSIRGIVASSDPRLSLNTTAAEITTDDWLDPDGTGSGFIVNQTAASNANVSGASYIGLSFA